MAQAPRTFFLVPAFQGAVGHAIDQPGLRVNFDRQDVSDTYYRLAPHWQAGAGCQMIVEYWDGHAYHITAVRNSSSRSGGTGEHAEEVLLSNFAVPDIVISGALINLPPCDGGRYRGKNCMDYFRPHGRSLNGALRHFLAANPVTPIFFREGQTEKGTSAVTTVGVKSQTGAVEEMIHMPGLVPGQPYWAAKEKKWFIAGQESSRTTEGDLLGRLMAIRASSRKGEYPITQATWYYKNVHPNIARNVYARLPRA